MKLKECEIAKSTLLAKSMIYKKRKYPFEYNGYFCSKNCYYLPQFNPIKTARLTCVCKGNVEAQFSLHDVLSVISTPLMSLR